jgi:fumarate hydratase subunit alpha
MLIAKHALLRRVGEPSPDRITPSSKGYTARGSRPGHRPMGYGGKVTALAVHVESFPAHSAPCP